MKWQNNLSGIRIKGIPVKRHRGLLRAMHWVLVPATFSLIINGSYVHKPSRTKSFNNMDTARKMHFTAQYFLVSYLISRAYYGWANCDYKDLLPNRKDMLSLPKFLRYTIFLRKKKPHYPKYNPGQKLLFVQMAVLFPLQILTGYAMYSASKLQKLSRIFGGLGKTRLVHYLSATVITGLISGHIYFALTDDLAKLKSIFTGYFTPK
ncbi:MAG: cytochrome b/b6 domain-containing protein [Firmicutes bacterium]|nr:cytochrome b/b6 domain-containing protein [Bacillota bacterium]